jgi:hypothetical protein
MSIKFTIRLGRMPLLSVALTNDFYARTNIQKFYMRDALIV